MLRLMHTSGRRVFAARSVSLATVGFLACTDDDFTVDGPRRLGDAHAGAAHADAAADAQLDSGAPDAEVFEEAGTVVID